MRKEAREALLIPSHAWPPGSHSPTQEVCFPLTFCLLRVYEYWDPRASEILKQRHTSYWGTVIPLRAICWTLYLVESLARDNKKYSIVKLSTKKGDRRKTGRVRGRGCRMRTTILPLNLYTQNIWGLLSSYILKNNLKRNNFWNLWLMKKLISAWNN